MANEYGPLSQTDGIAIILNQADKVWSNPDSAFIAEADAVFADCAQTINALGRYGYVDRPAGISATDDVILIALPLDATDFPATVPPTYYFGPVNLLADLPEQVAAKIADMALSAAVVDWKYIVEFDSLNLEQLNVIVCPNSRASSILSRTTVRDDVEVNVYVAKRLSKRTDNNDYDRDEFSGLLNIVQAIDQQLHFMIASKNGEVIGRWLKSANTPIYHAGELREHRNFFSLLTLTFVAEGK